MMCPDNAQMPLGLSSTTVRVVGFGGKRLRAKNRQSSRRRTLVFCVSVVVLLFGVVFTHYYL